MTRSMWSSLLFVLAACAAPAGEPVPASSHASGGSDGPAGVVTAGGRPVAGAFVTVREGAVATTVATDADGRFVLPASRPGPQTAEVRRAGFAPAIIELASSASTVQVRLEPAPERPELAPSHLFLGELPDGVEKRRFVLDCTGCHVFDASIARSGGVARTEADWRSATQMMLSFAGAHTGFPIISVSRDAASTAAWLAQHLSDGLPPRPASTAATVRGAVITEYDLPNAADLPHDLALDDAGGVVITGMLTGVMYRLDPATGAFETIPIPVPQANPRAVEIDGDGAWWVLLGGPRKLARYTPATRAWSVRDLDMYPHDIVLDPAGRIWFNGHFTKDPERIGYVNRSGGDVVEFRVPTPPMDDGGSTIPYGFRRAPDGTLWGTQLHGNRLLRFDPRTSDFQLWDLPTPHSGPRRLDVGPDGVVWIPEYSGNRLVRFDPRTERFTGYEYPTPDALPYIARVDARTGKVWVATAAADAVARFDPATGVFAEVRLPGPAALVRHIVVAADGTLWGAYSPFPPRGPKVFRVVVPD